MTQEKMEQWVELTEGYIRKEQELFEFIRDSLDNGSTGRKVTSQIAAKKREISDLKAKANSILNEERIDIGKRIYSGFGTNQDAKEVAINQVVFGVAAGNLSLDEAVGIKQSLEKVYKGPVLGKTM